MYNRYIPTANGSYVRRQVEEPSAPRRAAAAQPQAAPAAAPVEALPCPEDAPVIPAACGPCQPKQNFLQRLLPQNLDLGDLLILLILLLLMLDSEEQSDWLTVLLTVAAFLILQ